MKTILITAPSGEDRSFFKDALDDEGYQLVFALNGEDAVSLAAEHAPDLVMIEVVLPGINGFQTTRRILKNRQAGPTAIVLMDKAFSETNKVWALKQGARDYIRKPERHQDLLAAIAQAREDLRATGSASVEASDKPASFDVRELTIVERSLAHFMGPLASVLVKKLSCQAKSLDDLYSLLADHLTNEADRQQFLKSSIRESR